MSYRPVIPRSVQIFLWLTVPTSVYGLWQAVAPYEITWWRIKSPPITDIERYAELRPLTERALQVDYLMDKMPEDFVAKPEHRARIRRRQRNTGQRFRAQYALAPTLVYRVISLRAVRQRAWRYTPYYVMLDPAFHSTQHDLLKVLRPIAGRRQLEIEIHKVESGFTLVVMKPKGEEPLPYWASPVDD